MPDDPPVTVNIVGNLDPLKDALSKGAAMVSAFTANVAQADIRGKAGAGSSGSSGTADSSSPYAPTVDIGKRLIAQLSQLETTGEITSDNSGTAKDLLSQVTRTLEELLGALVVLDVGASAGGPGEEKLEQIRKAIHSLEEIMAQGLSIETTGLAPAIADALAGVLNSPQAAQEPQQQKGTGESQPVTVLGAVTTVPSTANTRPTPVVLTNATGTVIPPALGSAGNPPGKVIDNSGGKLSPVSLPTSDDPETQIPGLLKKLRQYTAEKKRLEVDGANGGNVDAERYKQVAAAIEEARRQLNDYITAGVRIKAKPKASGAAKDPLLDTVGMAEPSGEGSLDEQYQALSLYDAALNKSMENMERMGQKGTTAFNSIKYRIELTRVALDDLDKQIAKEKASAPKQKAVKEATPPPLPTDPGILETTENIVKLTEAAGVSTGNLGTLAKYAGNLRSAFAGVSTGMMAAAAGLVAFIAVVAVAAAVIAGITILLTKMVSAANAAEKQIISLSGGLGSLDAGKMRVKEIEMVVEGSGVDPQSIIALHSTLSRRAQDALLTGPGLDLMVRASARLDPSSAAQFGTAIGAAYDTLRTNPQSITANIEELTKLGLITGDAANQLEILSRSGANSKQVWRELWAALQDNADAAGNANQSLGGMVNRLNTDVSSTWNQMLKTMGEKIAAELGPHFDKLMTFIESMKPKLISVAASVGAFFGKIAGWLGDAMSGAIDRMQTFINMFKNGEIGKFLNISLGLATLSWIESFVNGMAYGVQYFSALMEGVVAMLFSKDAWSGLGDMLTGSVYLMFGSLAGLTGFLFGAIDPVVGWLKDAMKVMVDMVIGGFKIAAASLMFEGEDKDKLWNEGEAQMGNTIAKEREKREAKEKADEAKNGPSWSSKIAKGAKEKGDEWAVKGADKLGEGNDKMQNAFDNTAGGKAIKDDNFYKPNIFKDEIATLGKVMDDLWNKNKPKEKEEKKPDKEAPELTDPFGQGGPSSIADSLQAVGGGGLAAGMSIDEKILEENKEQNRNLRILAGQTTNANPAARPGQSTPSVGGAFGGKGDTQPVEVLMAIHNTLIGIYDMFSRIGTAPAGKSGSLVTTRG